MTEINAEKETDNEKKKDPPLEKKDTYSHTDFFFFSFQALFCFFYYIHQWLWSFFFLIYIFFYVFMYFIWIFVPYCILSLYWPILCTFFRFRCFLAVISRLFSSSSFFTYQGLISWGRNRRHTRAGATVTNQKIYYKGKYEK